MSPPLNRRRFTALSAALAAAALSPSLRAQGNWPARPVRLVLGYAPGGGSDVMARVLSQPMIDALGQPVIVDNKPGASGNIATVEAARATADGYTLLFAPTTQLTANPYIFKMPVDPEKDLVPVAAVGRYPLHLVTRLGLPFKTFKEFLDHGRANPNKLTYASAGPGTTPHLVAAAMLQQAGIQAVHVPYKGSGPALQAMLTGEADFVIDPGIAFPHVRNGKLALLATAGNKRIAAFPDVPTMKEAGLPQMDFYSWVGMFSPAGTPAAVNARVSEVLSKAVTNPVVIDKFLTAGAEVIYLNASDFQALIKRETQVFSRLVRDLNIKADS
ncbi:Bug family tripartite tricarboxylate transporter substrate binding protein [Hydrogenophaga sp. BPS33]|uniref:Bug family tripartite tricarboxylate transporter substrate binding protein n=1 Tax=Hydrogenophaga sp. BPS33 TaxID=2651974 RepID=UPI00131F9B89|nr:tripartite tricarboxylate transporter substrate binding protein [Hydrogenophaga sp. BPS33]QHE84306.1 tripartite tricarboxylate transporter substrate binding protein [Hydrogenophaga sp. BPS33]